MTNARAMKRWRCCGAPHNNENAPGCAPRIFGEQNEYQQNITTETLLAGLGCAPAYRIGAALICRRLRRAGRIEAAQHDDHGGAERGGGRVHGSGHKARSTKSCPPFAASRASSNRRAIPTSNLKSGCPPRIGTTNSMASAMAVLPARSRMQVWRAHWRVAMPRLRPTRATAAAMRVGRSGIPKRLWITGIARFTR